MESVLAPESISTASFAIHAGKFFGHSISSQTPSTARALMYSPEPSVPAITLSAFGAVRTFTRAPLIWPHDTSSAISCRTIFADFASGAAAGDFAAAVSGFLGFGADATWSSAKVGEQAQKIAPAADHANREEIRFFM